ncbi:o-succinylbenzoate synthase [Actinopolymorpha singaporensis]|uniref:o-succinylbenzoate synthase n=1 Tax=Actinopolymorpha singaporensis TaxID=117157 RepID=A0A1H1Y7N2_9ACTN|nr:o-succinylbenzoate synthase [Actinopolymorpha singaporensis]SDT17414.1 O-succinylbenzoate synthase [Actinopolymorpha singaporensis]
MQISAAELFAARLPLVHEFETSSHRKAYLEHILVRVTDAGGAVGWGEIASPSGPYYCAETVQSCWHVAEHHLLPAVVGAGWSHPGEVPALWSKVRGNEFAKAGVDMACWDLWSTATGVPLAGALGGTRDRVVAGVSLGIEPTPADLVAQVARQVEAGYPRVKLKIAPGWDVEPVRAVRAAFPDLDLHVDANGAYTEDPDHLAALRGLDGFGLTMVEQPFAPRDLLAHARLRRVLRTPVCLDESVTDLHDLRTALALEAVAILNIKVSRMGGLTAAVAAHDLARDHDVPVWCGGMHEFGVGRAANVALSSLPGFTLPSDVSASDKYYARDVVRPPITADHGLVDVPWKQAGSGHSVDEEFVREISSRTARVSAG